MDIRDKQGNVIASPSLSKDAVYVEELSSSIYVKLTWYDVKREELPVGSYIVPFDDGVKYILLDPYTPTAEKHAKFKYEPEFLHPMMWLSKLPFVHLEGDTTSWATATKRYDWTYVGTPTTIAGRLVEYINTIGMAIPELGSLIGTGWTAFVSTDIKTTASLSFDSVDVLSAAAEIANAFDVEYHFDFEEKVFHFGNVNYLRAGDTNITLKSGVNVGVASVSSSNEDYYNCFVVKGSTRNLSQPSPSGDLVQVNERLSLNEASFPGSMIDMRTGSKSGEPMLIKELLFDDIYPKLELYLYKPRERKCWLYEEYTDSKGNTQKRRIEDANGVLDTSDGKKYKYYSKWYIRLAYYDRVSAENIGTFIKDGITYYWHDYLLGLSKEDVAANDSAIKAEEALRIPVRQIMNTPSSDWNSSPAYFWRYVYQDREKDIKAINNALSENSVEGSSYVAVSVLDDIINLDSRDLDYIRQSLPDVWSALTISVNGVDPSSAWKKLADYSTTKQSASDTYEAILNSSRLIADKTPGISFLVNEESGALNSSLAGREFEIVFFGSETKENEDNVNDETFTADAGDYRIVFEDGDIIIPTTSVQGLVPRGGNTPSKQNNLVTLYNVVVDDVYKTTAQNELYEAAQKEIAKLMSDLSTYTVDSNPIVFAADAPTLYAGRKVTYSNGQDLNGGTEYTIDTRITKLTRYLSHPEKVEISMGNEIRKGSIESLKDDIQTIITGGYGGGDGSGSFTTAQFVQLLTNYGSKLFLSKNDNDTAKGVIKFLKGILFGSNGSGVTVNSQNGETYATVDRLKVNLKAYFESLEVQHVSHVGGKLVVTAGGGVVVAYVEEKSNAYRCYFLAEQEGQSVQMKFQVGDEIMSKDFNISAGLHTGVSNHFYWRRCTAISSSPEEIEGKKYYWIDLSKSDCADNSDAPLAGDTIVQIGWEDKQDPSHTDPSRQNAIVISSVDDNSPSIILYHGIHDFSFNGHDYVRLEFNSSTGMANVVVYGDFYYGARDEKNYIRFDQEKGELDIKAKLSIQSTVDDKGTTLEDYIKDNGGLTQEQIQDLIDATSEDLQKQIDGAIETWYYEGEPALTNAPAKEWNTTEDKNKHIGDLYYDKQTGKAYRFLLDNNVYKWVVITDTDITTALSNAAKAQETADGKMTVFSAQPTPPYQIGDIWVNATYPNGNTEKNASNNKYYNDILRCTTSRKEGNFSITEWMLASDYGELLDNFVSSIYNVDKEAFQSQIDRKIETWFTDTDPSGSWNDAEKAKHNGDIWYKSDNTAYHYDLVGGTYTWVKIEDSDALKALQDASNAQDTADGKRRIFTSQPTNADVYDVGDLWVNATYGTYKNDILRCNTHKDAGVAFNISHWTLASKYTDDSALDKFKNDISYLTAALQQTTIQGGLVLTSLISLGVDNTSAEEQKVYAGISGLYDEDKKGLSIAAWYGGKMLDAENCSKDELSDAAKALFRMDGSGYLAGGNISWDKDGNGRIGQSDSDYVIKWTGSGFSLGDKIKIGASSDTLETLVNFIAHVNDMFTLEKVDGVTRIKANYGLYSVGFISALGISSGGSSAGGATLLSGLEDVSISTPISGNILQYNGTEWVNVPMPSVAPDSSVYATRDWVLSQNYLTAHQSLSKLTIQRNGTDLATYNPKDASDKTINVVAVTSISVPTGLSAGTLQNNGSLSITFASGYSIPTTAKQTNWDSVYNWYTTAVGSDTDNVINKWEEVVAFLDTYTEADTLANLLSNKADKTIQIIAGNGLSGGGTLAANRTLTVKANGDSIDVSASGIKVNTIDNFTSTSTTKPLSASKGKNLNDRLALIEQMFEWDGDYIKAKAGFYSTSFVSALGISGGSSSGATSLSGLDDVNVGSQTDGQALVWSAAQSKWVAGTVQSTINLNVTGTGNAITAISKSGTTITATKGSTFALSSELSSYLPLAGGTITGRIYTSGTGNNKGYFLTDSTGYQYAGIVDNGSNLWIGSFQTVAQHHTGETYISAGYNGTTGNATIKISVPNDTNTGATNYPVLHSGNLSSYVTKSYVDNLGINASTLGSVALSGLLTSVSLTTTKLKVVVGGTEKEVAVPTWNQNTTGSAAKLTANAGSATQPVYFSGGVPVATTYSLSSTLNSGTQYRLAYYSGANAVSATGNIKYYANQANSLGAYINGLRIWGQAYGNDESALMSGEKGNLQYGDGCPQIQFSTHETDANYAIQSGSLLFTTHDSGNHEGVSFHFVSNQETDNSATWVVSQKFHAKDSIKIGDATISWDSSNGGCLKVDRGIYSTSFVSALGISGGSSSGATSLSGLDDVTLGTLSSGNLLQWNGTAWVNVPQSSITPNLSGYLPLAGGTITGRIYTSGTGNSRGYFLTDKTGYQYAGIVDNGLNLWIGATAAATQHHTGETFISAGYNGTTGNTTIKISVPNDTNTGATNYPVLHSGNLSTYVTKSYVENLGVTATEFASAKSITLTGDVTGTASSTGGWSIATTIGTGKVTNAMLAGSIANNKLANSSMTIAGTSVSLGGSISAATIGNALTSSSPAAYAAKLTTNAGSATQPVYFSGGVPVATTYSLSSTLNSGTQYRLAYYSGANAVSATGNIKYYANQANSLGAYINGLRIWGQAYGNDESALMSGEKGNLQYGDGCPQIQFSTYETDANDAIQSGSLLFTTHDSGNHEGVSFHFVSNQETDNYATWVVSQKFHAKDSIKIGDATISWDSSNGGCLKVDRGIYSTSFVSALGISGSSSSGATSLSGLDDVTLGTLSSGNLLQWNGTSWVNVPQSSIVPSLTSSQIISALGYTPYNNTNPNGYITSSALSGYLPLAGGTMSNTNIVTNLNADLLDGYHYTSFPLRVGGNLYVRTGQSVKLLTFTRSKEKGWLRISLNDSNSAGACSADFLISWSYDATNETKSVAIKCLYSVAQDVSTRLFVVRTTGNTFDLYFTPISTSSKVGYVVYGWSDACTINNYSTAIVDTPTATYSSSIGQLYANLGDYVTLSTTQTITGAKTFTNTLNVNKTGTNYTDTGGQIPLLYATWMANGITYSTDVISAIISNASNSYNADVRVGSKNGALWLSSGESGATLATKLQVYNNESVWISSDSEINFITNAANDSTSYAHVAKVNSTGIIPIATNTRSLGTSSLKWSNVYATTFTGDLSGNASTATNASQLGGVALSGLLTSVTAANGSIGVTVGGTTKTATASGTWAISVSGNAATATQLQTARTLWGQSFNGTGNVDGLLTITASGDGAELLRFKTERSWSFYQGGSGSDASLALKSLTDSKSFYIKDNNGNSVAQFFTGTTSYVNLLNGILYAKQNVGIGTTSPAYKLDVSGTGRYTGTLYVTSSGGGVTINSSGTLSASSTISSASNIEAAGALRTSGKRIYFGSDSEHYIELNDNGFHFSHGLYSESFVSALGLNSSSSSSGSLSVVDGVVQCSGMKGQNICYECDSNGANPTLRTNEINNYSHGIHLQYNSSNNVSLCYGGGKVGIGTVSPAYKLDVNGIARFTSTVTFNANIVPQGNIALANNKNIYLGNAYLRGVGDNVYFDGIDTDGGTVSGINGMTITASSDIRLKNVIQDVNGDINEIANAPIFRFTWKSKRSGRMYIGTSAQYWQTIYPELVFGDSENESLSLDYASLALTASVTAAREIVLLKERVKALENELEQLKSA